MSVLASVARFTGVLMIMMISSSVGFVLGATLAMGG